MVGNLQPLSKGRQLAHLNLARGSEEKGFIVDSSAVKAALIVLIQHSLVKVVMPAKSGVLNGKHTKYKYALEHDRAIFIQRYPRFVEYARKMYQEIGAALVEEILVRGRTGTVEAIKATVECVGRYLSTDGDSEVSCEEKLILAQKAAETLKIMVDDGCIELVLPIGISSRSDFDEDGDKEEFGNDKYEKSMEEDLDGDDEFTELTDDLDSIDDGLKSILDTPQYKKVFVPGAVWRVNFKMFHATLRAFYLGRLVAERYSQLQFAGAIVSAALKYTAAKEFSPKYEAQLTSEEQRQQMLEDKTVFTPNAIMDFLPPVVLAELKNRAGGARANLSSTLSTMTTFVYPPVAEEVEEAQGHPEGGKFEIATRQLLSYLKGRIFHQMIRDHFGDVGARICSILEAKGHLEGDAVAENAMVPAKDAREMLHQLYKENYISMLYLHQSKQHNPANAMYLWCVDKKLLQHTVLKNISRALINLRLRRQHEVEQGKDWIERAKFAGDTDENYSEMDKINYNKFCQGLERIDNACLQLDETLMILKEYDGC
jgi:DNA-directed RNA polymerase III subunit RPC3|eukprot:scaffold327_cov237-Chaetoceros_neogracile.AAC.4